MTLLNVLHFPNPRLRLRAEPVEKVTPEIIKILDDMLETMYADRGVGLAAIQVNIQKRLIVMDVSDDYNEPLCFINPKIISAEGHKLFEEGCLSVPGIYEKVKRAENVVFTYMDKNNQSQTVEAEGLLADCIQHEIDHLNGKLFIDHLSPLKQERIRKKLEKQERHRL
ncbi:MAG TPA: peptide deformylase [Gammaproteobacteria bacterium]|nr:peptide deformylase [Gammaproteobacteria bacterium]